MMHNSEEDAEALRKAMKGSDEKAIIQIVAHRTNKERLEIKDAYKTKFNKDLIADLKSELHGKFEDAIVALFTEPIEYDCDSLRKAMKGFGTNEDTLIEIFSSRNPKEIQQIKAKYNEKYKRDLEADIKSEVKHKTLQHLLLSLLKPNRSCNTKPNQAQCKTIAEEIYKAGVKNLGTDESVFNKYFTQLSPAELACVSKEYCQRAGHNILDAIKKEFSGDAKKTLLAIIYAGLSPSEYFATRVHDAIKGWGTKNTLLIRVLVTRSEKDMPQIVQFYKQIYGKDMVKDVEDDISGDYKRLMIELINS